MKTKAFRSALHGYHRDDVNAYIADQNQLFLEAEGDYKKTISDLRDQLNALRTENSGTDSLREQLQRAEALIASQNELAEQARTLSEEQAARIQALEQECNALREKSGAQEAAESARSAEAMYDQMRTQLGGLMIDARTNADETIRRAKQQSQEILQQAEKQAEEITQKAREAAEEIQKQADEKRRHISDYISLTVKKATMECVSEYSARLNHIKTQLDTLLFDVRAASDKTVVKTGSILNAAVQDIEDAISGEQK